MSVNIIGIVPAANLIAANKVLEAMGRGPESLTQGASTSPNPAWDDPPTHYYMSDQGVADDVAAAFLRFGQGDLPALAPGLQWGVDGVISSTDALAAITSQNFAFASYNDGFSPQQQVAAALAAYSPRLYDLPNPPE